MTGVVLSEFFFRMCLYHTRNSSVILEVDSPHPDNKEMPSSIFSPFFALHVIIIMFYGSDSQLFPSLLLLWIVCVCVCVCVCVFVCSIHLIL